MTDSSTGGTDLPASGTAQPAGGTSEPAEQGAKENAHLKGVARGGSLNLVGAVIWGASNFALLAVLTRTMGAESAGIVIVGIAVFNILATLSGMGCSSGLVRLTSRNRARGRPDLLRPTLKVAIVPVLVFGLVAALLMVVFGEWLADVFGGGESGAEIEATLRAMAPFLPVAAVYWVLIQGSRGFDTMRPVVTIDKIGRGLMLPPLAWLGVNVLELDPAGVAGLWAATNLVALIPAIWATRQLIRKAEERGVHDHGDGPAAGDLKGIAAEFWRFTAPRSVGQVSEVAVNWMDTLIVGAMLGAAAAGIYGAGTRYLLPGLFVADAVMQVVGPRISGMLSRGEQAESQHMLRIATGWQSSILWPIYTMVLVFAPVLLRLFGEEVVAATGALRWLALAVVLSALGGPAASVILMSGRSMLSMVNTLVLLVVNIGGNLLIVPHWGLGGAGFVWAITLLVAVYLPLAEIRVTLDLSTMGKPGFVAGAIAATAYLPVALLSAWLLGQSWLAVLLAGIVGSALFVLGMIRFGGPVELAVLRDSVRPTKPGVAA